MHRVSHQLYVRVSAVWTDSVPILLCLEIRFCNICFSGLRDCFVFVWTVALSMASSSGEKRTNTVQDKHVSRDAVCSISSTTNLYVWCIGKTSCHDCVGVMLLSPVLKRTVVIFCCTHLYYIVTDLESHLV